MGSNEDSEAERLGWASYRVGPIIAVGLVGVLLPIVGLFLSRLLGLPGLTMIGVGVGGVMVLWALGRGIRKVIGESAYSAWVRRQTERDQAARKEWERLRRLYEGDEGESGPEVSGERPPTA